MCALVKGSLRMIREEYKLRAHVLIESRIGRLRKEILHHGMIYETAAIPPRFGAQEVRGGRSRTIAFLYYRLP